MLHEDGGDAGLADLFPNLPITGSLAGPIASGVNGMISDLVNKFIASDQFASVWIQLNTIAQKGLVAKVSGDAALLEASQLPVLERALSQGVLGQRQKMLRSEV